MSFPYRNVITADDIKNTLDFISLWSQSFCGNAELTIFASLPNCSFLVQLVVALNKYLGGMISSIFGLLYSDFSNCSPLARIVSLFLHHAKAKIFYVSLACDRRKSSVQCVILGLTNCSENIFSSVLRSLCLDRVPFSYLCLFVSCMWSDVKQSWPLK